MAVARTPSPGIPTRSSRSRGSAQDVAQVLLGVGEHLVNRDVAPQLLAERGNACICDAAWHDHLGPGQVTATVERETVHRDVLAHPDADSSDLAVGSGLIGQDPYSAAPLDAPGGDPEVRTDLDHHVFEAAHMGDDVNRGGEPDDGIAHQLARTVPGDLAAPVDVDDRGAVEGALMRFGSLARGVDGGVIEQQHGVWFVARNHSGMNLALAVPRSLVVDVVRGKTQVLDTHATRIRGRQTCLSKG